jgi:hypothetical protein
LSEAIRRHRKLNRHEWIVAPSEQGKPREVLPNGLVFSKMRQDIFNHTFTANLNQKVVDDYPLVMPAYALLNIFKWRRGLLLHQLVMKLQHRCV